MVAIVAGGQLGLGTSSWAELGSDGVVGKATQGRAGESVLLNAATGNLVLRQRDEWLTGRGPDAELLRTYNSLGLMNGGDDSAGPWLQGWGKQVYGLEGTLNAAGSSLWRRDADGARARYLYDAAMGTYLTTAGEGAHDRLDYDASLDAWTWTEGSSRISEGYEKADEHWRLATRVDDAGNALTYRYDAAGRLERIITPAGEFIVLDHTEGRLTQVRSITADGAEATRTRYAYDNAGRLTEVSVDLSPDDNSIADGNLYVTSYSYDGDSSRVATLRQSDGSHLAFGYAQVGEETGYRLVSLMEHVGGTDRETRLIYDLAARATTIIDPTGARTVLTYDSAQRLLSIAHPAADGAARTVSFSYDSQGNVASRTDASGRRTVFAYDAQGNRVLERDALGNIVTRQFNANAQLLSETTYLQPDPDGDGVQSASQARTRRHVLDADSGLRLRYAVGAGGSVSEYRYDAFGQRISEITYTDALYDVATLSPGAQLDETTLAAWAAERDPTRTQLTTYTYDARGALASRTVYARVDDQGAGIADGSEALTRYIYGPRGELLHRIDPRVRALHTPWSEGFSQDAAGLTELPDDFPQLRERHLRGQALDASAPLITSYLYDGLGRLLISVGPGGTRTLVSHDDANRRTVTTLANGLVTTATYDEAGALLAETRADGRGGLGSTHYAYDSGARLRLRQDANGVRQHLLYDAAGRKAAEIDGDGSLTEFGYDANDRLISTRLYANALSAEALGTLVDEDGAPAAVTLADIRPTAAANDRIHWRLYDAAGRLSKSIDAAGAVVEYSYDGRSQLIRTRAYATPVSPAAISRTTLPTDRAVSPTASTEDRVTRHFHDAEGRVVGELDAAGALTEQRYDSAGHLTWRIRYATLTNTTLRASGTLRDLIPTANANDQITRYDYDAAGRRTGELDALRYYTSYIYDVAGNLLTRVRHATAGDNAEAGAPQSSPDDQITRYAYDAAGRLLRETRPDGVLITHEYDALGLLVRSTTAAGSDDVRIRSMRYDSQGRLIAELSGEGSARLAGLTADDDIAAVWRAHGMHHSYDATGLRTATTDALGQRTLFFHDRDGRLTHTVNALGEVAATLYDAQGQSVQTLRYATRLGTEDLARLRGGLRDASFDELIATLTVAAQTRTTYDAAGRVTTRTDARAAVTRMQYNTFSETTRIESPVDALRTVVETRAYDARGRLRESVSDAGGIARTERSVYDAFGRRVSHTGATQNQTVYRYDALDRVAGVRDALGESTLTVYDAFDRVLRITDRMGQVTAYRHDLALRSVQITTPEGVRSTSTRNAHGELITESDGNGNLSRHSYDRDGRLLRSTRAGVEERSVYDAGGRLIRSTDARGIHTTYAYDAAGRLIRRTLDPREQGHDNGLNLVTEYRHDALGRALWSRDPGGVWSRSEFDANGQLIALTLDPRRGPDAVEGEDDDNPQGLQLRTEYSYDAAGNSVRVTRGAGTAAAQITAYTYDKLGRRTEERVDPDGLNLITAWTYDAHGNVQSQRQPGGATTRYVYDAGQRLRFTIDALNQVTRQDYDVEGRLVLTRRYARAIASLPTTLNQASIEAALTPDAADRITRQVFDADGRLRHSIDTAGFVTSRRYDGNGNLLVETLHAKAVSLSGVPDLARLEEALSPDDTADRSTRHTYDAANRKLFSLDAGGYVTAMRYDAGGNLIAQTRHANAVALTGTPSTIDITAADIATALRADSAQDRSVRHFHDAAGRLRFTLDALGYLNENTYDTRGNLLRETRYANALTGTLGSGAQPVIITGGTPDDGQVLADPARDRSTAKVYDAAGRVTESRARIDARSEAITRIRHDAAGRAVAVTDALGNTAYLYYDGAGREVMQVDPAGYVTARVYGSDGHIDRITRYGAAAQGNWDSTRAPAIVSRAPTTAGSPYVIYSSSRDQVTTLTHDALGRQVRLQDAEGAAESIAYNAFGERARFTNKAGGVFVYEYDNRGLMSVEQLPVTSRDAEGNATAVRNTYVYDAFGQRIAQTEAAGLPEARTTTFEYDALGRLVARRQAAVAVYDPLQDRTIDAATPTERWVYDAADNVLRHTSAGGHDLIAWYDGLNRKRAEVNALGVYTVWDYDSAGNRLRQVTYANTVHRQGGAADTLRPRLVSSAPTDRERADAWVQINASEDRAVTFSHDALGRQTGTRVDDLTLGAYDTASGEYRIRTGALVTTQTLDANGHVLISSDANGNLTRHFYDRAGQRVATIDPARFVTVWERNSNGDATLEHRYATALAADLDLAAITGLAQLRAAGALRTSADDRITTYVYDQMNRLVQETRRAVLTATISSTSGSLTTKTDDADIYTAYNTLGLVSRRTDAMGVITDISYDALGRRTREQGAVFTDYQGRAVRPTTDIEYDGLGLVRRQIERGLDATGEDDDRITVQRHDAAGRLIERIDASGQRTTFDYDLQGNVTRRILHARRHADGSSTDDTVRYFHDALGRQLRSLDLGSGRVEESQYNVFGEITAKRTYAGEAPEVWDERTRYDRAGRAWMSNAGDGIARVFVFDAQGNATLRIGSATRDLSAMTLAQVLALDDTQKSVSVYDARNLLVDSYEPEMQTTRTSAVVQANQTGQGVFFSSTVPVQFALTPTVVNTDATPTDPVTAGSTATTGGAISIRGSVYSKPKPPLLGSGGGGGFGSSFVQYTMYYSTISVTLPTRTLAAYGSGALRLRWSTAANTWSGSRGASGEIVQPAGTSTFTLPEVVVNQKRGSTYASWGSVSVELFQATAAGEVRLGAASFAMGSSISGSQPIDSQLHFQGQPAGATRMLLAYRAAGTQDPYSLMWVPRVTNTGGTPISGWFAAARTALPQAAMEYEYFAMDDAGTVLNRQSGSFDLRSTTAPTASQKSGGTLRGANQALVDSAGAVHFVEQGNATALTVKWRRRNSGEGWSSVTMPAASVIGIYTPGWFGMAGSAFAHGTEYDLDITASRDSNVVNRARAQLTRAADGRIGISPFVSYRPQAAMVRLTDQPEAQVLELSYRAAGSTGDYQSARLSPTAPDSGSFLWDASALVGDIQGNTEYELLLRAFDATGFARNETRASVRLGAAPAVLSASTTNQSILRITPPHDSAARIALGYRRQGSTDAYSALAAQRIDGEFRASIAGIKPPASGSTGYEYVYDSYDAEGNLLGRDTGTFTLSATAATNTRLQWVLQDLGASGTRIHRAQRHDAFGQIIAETDGLGRTTESAYNTLGNLIEKRSPQTNTTLSNGFVQSLRPTTRYVYDLAGRAIGTTDANGNLRTQAWRAGASGNNALVLERGADGALLRHRYDVFGDRRQTLNALWDGKSAETPFSTEYTYDKLSQLVELKHPERAAGSVGNAGTSALRGVESWTWDGAGHRIAHVNTLGDTDTTVYDSLGRVTATTSAQGFTTSHAYEYRADLRGVGSARTGGWRKTTTEPTGRTSIEDTDTSGRLTWRQDLGGHQFSYVYNHAGWLATQSASSGQRIVREYYANGLLKSYWDQVTGAFSSYAYDANGNRTFEGYVTLRQANSLSAGVREHHQHATLEYDELNRLVRVFDPRADIRYEYDAVGNRRRVFSSYHDGVDGSRVTQDYWYSYDKENRFLVTLGQLSGGRATSATTSARVIAGTTGVAIAYDAAGRRVQAVNGTDATQENYAYSAEGYLVEVRIDTNLTDKTPGVLRSRRDIDLAGRVTQYVEYDATGNPNYSRETRYDKDHRTLSQSGTDGSISFRYFTDATDDAASADAGGAGALALTTSVKDGTTVNTFHAYEYWDSARGKAQTNQAYNPAIGDRNNNWKPGYARHEYDVNGNLARALDAGPDGVLGNSDDRQLRYLTDAQGLILLRDEIAGAALNRVQRYYYANGVRVGDVGNDGPSRIDYAQALARRGENRDYRQWKPVSAADFDQNYEPVGPNYPGHTPARYTVKAGDTLPAIAAALWGDRSQWYLLAEANGLDGGETLIAGQVLSVPNKLTNVHNNAGTFRVYNPGEAIGDTSPTLPDVPPPPAQDKGCGLFVTILIVAVVVAVSVYTAGVATAWFATAGVPAGAAAGTAAGAATVSAATAGGAAAMSLGTAAMAGGAGMAGFLGAMAGAAVGSAVGQGLSMAAGMQEDFSWRQVGLSALSAGLSAGLSTGVNALVGSSNFGQWLQQSSWGQAAQSAVGNMVTQGLSTQFGFQPEFDWANVGASALSAAVTHQVNQRVGSWQYDTDANPQGWKEVQQSITQGYGEADATRHATRQLLSSAAANVAREAVSRGPFNLRGVVTDTLGGVTGNAMVNAVIQRDRAFSLEKIATEAIGDTVRDGIDRHVEQREEAAQSQQLRDALDVEQPYTDYEQSAEEVARAFGARYALDDCGDASFVGEYGGANYYASPGELLADEGGHFVRTGGGNGRSSKTGNSTRTPIEIRRNPGADPGGELISDPWGLLGPGITGEYRNDGQTLEQAKLRDAIEGIRERLGASGLQVPEIGRSLDGGGKVMYDYSPDQLARFQRYDNLEALRRAGVLQLDSDWNIKSIASNKRMYINPSKVRFTQEWVSYFSSDKINTLDTTGPAIRDTPHEVKAIDVVVMPDGRLTSLDNRRLAAAYLYGAEKIRVVVHAPDDPVIRKKDVTRFSWLDRRTGERYVPKTWAEAAAIRIFKQGKDFREAYPKGSSAVPEIRHSPRTPLYNPYMKSPTKRL